MNQEFPIAEKVVAYLIQNSNISIIEEKNISNLSNFKKKKLYFQRTNNQ